MDLIGFVTPLQNHVLYQGCQNGPVTGAITGYFKVFAACKLLEESEKNGRLKSCKIEKEKEIVLIMPSMFFFVKHLPYLGKHIPTRICVPLPWKHISLVICVPLLRNTYPY